MGTNLTSKLAIATSPWGYSKADLKVAIKEQRNKGGGTSEKELNCNSSRG